jgi:type VI secretion system protein VasD
MSRWLRGVAPAAVAGLVAVLAGCSAPPPPPTVVALSLAASDDVNPTASGAAAPVVVRIYQLASPSSFGNAEFFQLFNQDQQTLGTDLVKREDVVLAPGQSKQVTLQPTDQVKAIGLFAGYRDYAAVAWRTVMDVTPHKTTNVAVTVGKAGIVAKPAGGKAGS